MFGYYFNLALRSFRRNKVLTALMVLTIAVGIGATMTTLTLYFVLSGDPIPEKSSQLFHPRLDARPQNDSGQPDPEPPEQLTRYDAEELLRQARGDRQALMSGGSVTILPEGMAAQPFRASAQFTSADFFPMFQAPLHSGRVWNGAEDDSRARVAVISDAMAEQLFPGQDPLGREIRLPEGSLEVIGVLGEWSLTPRFYDLESRRFEDDGAQVFTPFSTSRELELSAEGSMACWGSRKEDGAEAQNVSPHALNAPCVWVHYWVELDSPDKVDGYLQYLTDYSEQQRAAGRFESPANVRLHSVMDWLDYKRVVPNDVRLQMWLAFGFLAVCLVNTVGLLLAKFLRRSGEIGVRRALGASRMDIFRQCLVEAGTIGVVGGAFGLLLAIGGLWLVRQQPDDYAQLAQMDAAALAFTFVLALVASLMAGALPAWRAMQITPAIQLKSQ